MKKETSNLTENEAMQYEPVLSEVILDWFDKNYIESRSECAKAVIKATIDYPFTVEELKEKCQELRKTELKNQSLSTHIKIIGDLCNYGVNASIAGEKIREALFKMRE